MLPLHCCSGTEDTIHLGVCFLRVPILPRKETVLLYQLQGFKGRMAKETIIAARKESRIWRINETDALHQTASESLPIFGREAAKPTHGLGTPIALRCPQTVKRTT